MATPRARISIVLMAFSELRPQSLGNYTGTDDIRLEDFVEAKMNEEGITFTKVSNNARGQKRIKQGPPVKMYCSNLAADALQAAIKDYYKRKESKGSDEMKKEFIRCEFRNIKIPLENCQFAAYRTIID